jgi:ribonuclease HI
MRRLYISVAIPKITYGLEAWYTPPFLPEGKRVRRGSVKALTEFTKLQRIATLSIAGALRSTATDVLDGHTNILPMEQTLKKVCYRSLLRLSALPNSNPAAKILRRLQAHPETTHLSSLQRHLGVFNLNPRKIERFEIPPRHPPQKIKVHLEDSELFHHVDTTEYKIFTDGARSVTYTGAAAVLFKTDVRAPIKIVHHRLGESSLYGVKEAELVGCLLGVSLIQQIEGVLRTPISIYTDSQVALRLLANLRAKSGYQLISKFYDAATDAAERFAIIGSTPRINLRWVPKAAHIEGMKRADLEAKGAAANGSSPPDDLPTPLRHSLPSDIDHLKTKYLAELKIKWTAGWQMSPRRPRFLEIDSSFPFRKHYTIA